MILYLKYIILLFLIFNFIILSSQNIFFIGAGIGSDDQWNNAVNWNPQRIPNADDDVEIGNSNLVFLNGLNATVKSLKISGAATLTLNDTNVRLDVLQSTGDGLRMILQSHLVITDGTLAIRNTQGDGLYMENSSTLVNHGTLIISSFNGEGLHFQSNTTIDNYGDLFIDQLNGSLAAICVNGVDGSFTNQSSGELIISNCQDSNAVPFLIAPGALFEDHGEALVHEINCN